MWRRWPTLGFDLATCGLPNSVCSPQMIHADHQQFCPVLYVIDIFRKRKKISPLHPVLFFLEAKDSFNSTTSILIRTPFFLAAEETPIPEAEPSRSSQDERALSRTRKFAQIATSCFFLKRNFQKELFERNGQIKNPTANTNFPRRWNQWSGVASNHPRRTLDGLSGVVQTQQ